MRWRMCNNMTGRSTWSTICRSWIHLVCWHIWAVGMHIFNDKKKLGINHVCLWSCFLLLLDCYHDCMFMIMYWVAISLDTHVCMYVCIPHVILTYIDHYRYIYICVFMQLPCSLLFKSHWPRIGFTRLSSSSCSGVSVGKRRFKNLLLCDGYLVRVGIW